MIPLDLAAPTNEQVQAAARRLVRKIFTRVDREDGSFLLLDKRGNVVGAGFRRAGREELWDGN